MKCGIGLVKQPVKGNKLFIILLCGLLAACKTGVREPETFDWQGHRGARGEAPENSIPAMLRALQEGVKTLEMDVVLSKDSVVLLSHEPWFNTDICLDAKGQEWADSADRNLFHYDYSEIEACDCGTKLYDRFPAQEHLKTAKPRLLDVILEAEEAALMVNREEPFYNIEIKSKPEWDAVHYPSLEYYCDRVMETLAKANLGDRLVIQSFDPRALRYMHEKYPQVSLAYLSEDGERSPAEQIKELGFVPAIYSCEYSLLTEATVKQLQASGMKVIPWTVNEIADAERLKAWAVDGIITDYPARMISALGTH